MEQKQKTFLQIDSDFLAAKTIMHNGEKIELTFLEKGVYSHMKYRYRFFESKNQDYFESQQCIADVFATSLKTIQRAIKKLQDVGLIVVTATSKNNKYEVLDYDEADLSLDTVKHANMVRQTSFTKDTYIKTVKNTRNKQPTINNSNTSGIYKLDNYPF